MQALEGADAVVNLAGDPLERGRWTRERKATILESRVGTTRTLATAIASRIKRAPHIELRQF